MTLDGTRTQAQRFAAAPLRTNAPAVTPQQPAQRMPHAPDTPWGRLRGARGWSLRRLAELTGVNPAELSRIERLGICSPDQALRLLKTYGLAT